MIIDYLVQNYDWLRSLAQCFIYVGFLLSILLLPKNSPLLTLRGDLQDGLYYVRLILDNPPVGCNSRIEQMLNYAQYLSGLDFSTKGARSLIVTGAVLSIALSVQGVFLLTVGDSVDGLPLVMDAVLSIVCSFIFLMLAVFAPVICWINRHDAKKLRREAGRASAEYYLMLSEQDKAFNPDVSSEDDGTAGNQKGV